MRRNMCLSAVVAVGLTSFLMGRPVVAHHAFAAEYDGTKPVTIKGTITKMEWTNPHSWLHVDVKAPDGTVVAWLVEFGAPNALYRRGWKRTDLPFGAEVTINGYLSKTSATTVNAGSVIMPDGRRLFAGSSGTGSPEDKDK